jgi:small subunit ribosomal protein S20
MKSHIKKVVAAMDNKDKESLDAVLKKTVSYINRAATKGVIHKNNAARKVSRLSRKVNGFLQGKA